MMFFVDFLNRGLKDYRMLNNIGSDIMAILSILLSKPFFSNCMMTTITTMTTMTISFGKHFRDNEVLLKSYIISQYIFIVFLFDTENSLFLQVEVFHLIIKRDETVDILYFKLHFKSLFQLIHIRRSGSTTSTTITSNWMIGKLSKRQRVSCLLFIVRRLRFKVIKKPLIKYFGRWISLLNITTNLSNVIRSLFNRISYKVGKSLINTI